MYRNSDTLAINISIIGMQAFTSTTCLSDAMAHAFLYETIEWGRRDLKGRASGCLLACS